MHSLSETQVLSVATLGSMSDCQQLDGLDEQKEKRLSLIHIFLVPIQCEYYSLEGLAQLMSTVRQIKRLYNPSIELEGCLLYTSRCV